MKFVAIIIFSGLFQFLTAQGYESRIMVDQVGYYPGSVKVALIPECGARSFKVISAGSDEAVFEGKVEKAKYWPYSGDKVHIADFSGLSVPGEYIITCSDKKILDSHPFKINSSVYRDLAQSGLHGFYLARASTAIDSIFAGKFHRPAGHPDDKVYIHKSAATKQRAEGTIISSPRGWYDAGDYNKYITNSGITTFTLLELYEIISARGAAILLNIPEKNNDIPDLLDEILWNLRWMMTMQDPNDGGVYHKLTHKKFMEVQMPHEVNSPRYVVMKTTAATLDLAAVCGKAERIFREWEKELPGFADSCLSAAILAWEWAKQNPAVYYEQPDDIKTGAYGGKDVSDEWAWASIELFLSTGDESFLINQVEDILKYDVPEWGRVGTLGIYSLLNDRENSIESYKNIENQFLKSADKIYDRYMHSAYRVSIDSFPWGSNSHAINEGIFLLKAFMITWDRKYYDAAESTLHYVLGRNPTGFCFVTGTGTISPMHIHDRRSRADGIEEPLPGLLVGGPSKQAREDCGDDAYPSDFPALSYLDSECSYSTNEVAINWNAALAMLVNAMEVIQRKGLVR